MNYEQFLEQMKEDLTARFAQDLPPELADVRIGIRDVEKLQGESYRGLSFRSGDSPVEANLNMTGAFQAYEAGRPYEDILKEVEAQLMKVVDGGGFLFRAEETGKVCCDSGDSADCRWRSEWRHHQCIRRRYLRCRAVDAFTAEAGNGTAFEDAGAEFMRHIYICRIIWMELTNSHPRGRMLTGIPVGVCPLFLCLRCAEI